MTNSLSQAEHQNQKKDKNSTASENGQRKQQHNCRTQGWPAASVARGQQQENCQQQEEQDLGRGQPLWPAYCLGNKELFFPRGAKQGSETLGLPLLSFCWCPDGSAAACRHDSVRMRAKHHPQAQNQRAPRKKLQALPHLVGKRRPEAGRPQHHSMVTWQPVSVQT